MDIERDMSQNCVFDPIQISPKFEDTESIFAKFANNTKFGKKDIDNVHWSILARFGKINF